MYVWIEVDEGGDHRDPPLVMCPIGVVVGQRAAHGEVAVDVVTTETTVLGCLTASIQARIVSEVLLIVILHETMAG